MIKQVKLKTLHMYENEDSTDKDYLLWNEIAKYLDGEMAFVTESAMEPEKFLFLGLMDDKKDKEVHYLMEQDSMTGVYINDRRGFDKAWDKGEYERDGGYYLGRENVVLI